jgi:hypothetical protein
MQSKQRVSCFSCKGIGLLILLTFSAPVFCWSYYSTIYNDASINSNGSTMYAWGITDASGAPTMFHTSEVQVTITSPSGRSASNAAWGYSNATARADISISVNGEWSDDFDIVSIHDAWCPAGGHFLNGTRLVSHFTAPQHRYDGCPFWDPGCIIYAGFDQLRPNGTKHKAQDLHNQSTAYGNSVTCPENRMTVTRMRSDAGRAPYPACMTDKTRPPVNFVELRGQDGAITRFVHVKPNPALVVGAVIDSGYSIGTLDNSGCQSGPHLHMARYVNGVAVNFTNGCCYYPDLRSQGLPQESPEDYFPYTYN